MNFGHSFISCLCCYLYFVIVILYFRMSTSAYGCLSKPTQIKYVCMYEEARSEIKDLRSIDWLTKSKYRNAYRKQWCILVPRAIRLSNASWAEETTGARDVNGSERVNPWEIFKEEVWGSSFFFSDRNAYSRIHPHSFKIHLKQQTEQCTHSWNPCFIVYIRVH